MKKMMSVLAVFALVLAIAAPVMAADGAAVYKAKCAMCHGPDGAKSNPGMRALNSAEVQGQTDAQLTDITSKGKGKMPAYAGKLSDEEVKAVVAFMRTLKK